jgi:hypothetical protein
MEHVQDPALAANFQWDAKRLYKYDGNKYVRFYTEPSSGNHLWDIQVGISLLFDILYDIPFAIRPSCRSMAHLCSLFSMPTKPNFHHGDPLWDIQYMHVSVILILIFAMVVVLGEVNLWDGYQSCADIASHNVYVGTDAKLRA